jgi:hypothetical protein
VGKVVAENAMPSGVFLLPIKEKISPPMTYGALFKTADINIPQ